MPGITDTGFDVKLLQTIKSEVSQDLRDKISAKLDTSSEQPTGQLVGTFSREVALLWEVLGELYGFFDPANAEGAQLDNLAALVGVYRKSATKGTVTLELDLDASTTVPAGSISSVDSDNRWITDSDVTSTTAGTYTVTATAEEAGVKVANAGTITNIVTPVAGWNSVTNPSDANPGTDEESDTALRSRRDASLSLTGSGTVAAIRAGLLALEGMQSANVLENTTDSVDANGLSPHSVEAIVFDGDPPAEADNDIAQVIWDEKGTGTATGGSSSGTATDAAGGSQTVNFTRPTAVDIYVAFEITVDSTYPADGDTQLKNLVVAETNVGGDVEMLPGTDVIQSRIQALAFEIQGVVDAEVYIDTSPSPAATANIAINIREIADFDTSRITVTHV